MCRSWTFQEALLAQSLAIRFQNGTIVLGGFKQYDLFGHPIRDRDGCEYLNPRFMEGEGYDDQGPEQLSSNSSPGFEISGSGHLLTNLTPPTLNNNLPDLSCECVNGALFYSTIIRPFFDFFDLISFATVWNQLGCRSITSPGDIVLIFATALDLDIQSLLSNDSNEGQLFQSIVLSVTYLPFSLFFNTGPRLDQDGNHLNRWVPTKISRDLMTQPILSRQSSKLRPYGKIPLDGLLVYKMRGVLTLLSSGHLILSSGPHQARRIYSFGPSVSPSDRFVTTGYTSTYIFIEDRDLDEDCDIQRGACFYNSAPEHEDSKWRSNFIWKPTRNMTFICPLRLRIWKYDESSMPTLDLLNAATSHYLVEEKASRYQYEINYGTFFLFDSLF